MSWKGGRERDWKERGKTERKKWEADGRRGEGWGVGNVGRRMVGGRGEGNEGWGEGRGNMEWNGGRKER